MSRLFQPIKYGALSVRNRVVIAPMCMYSAKCDGLPNFFHEQQWVNYCNSGAGMMVVEATAVQPVGRISYADLGIWSDTHMNAFKSSISKVKSVVPTPIFIQLAHAGRKGSSEISWLGGGQAKTSDPEKSWQTHAPSAIGFRSSDSIPHALDEIEVADLIKSFAAGARRAHEAGFDGIELHAAHGYLLHEFLSGLANKRQDMYGGSEENRFRLLLEVLAATKATVPDGFPVGIRLSASDWMDGEELSWSIDQTVRLCKVLAEQGADYLHISSGGLHVDQIIPTKPLYQVSFAEAVKSALTPEQNARCPVIAVGLITTPQQAEGILTSGSADAVAIARGVLWNPRWGWHAAAELGAQVDVLPQYLRCQPQDAPRSTMKAF